MEHWPSHAANLSNVEEQIKRITPAKGVDVPSRSAGGSSPATLPLPLAAFTSLTITDKLDKASERSLNLAGPARESLAAGCSWPCMPTVASLWTQKEYVPDELDGISEFDPPRSLDFSYDNCRRQWDPGKY